jgi:autotransporter translocation and assembly factor TamB
LEENREVRVHIHLHLHLRIREHILSLIRRVRRVALMFFVLLLLFGGLVVGKNIFLSQLKREVRQTFQYGDLRMSYFPPAIVIENVRSVPEPPVFQARLIRVQLPFLSLLRNEKAVTVFLDSPEVRLRSGAFPPGAAGAGLPVSLPFTITRGLIRNGTLLYEGEGSSFGVSGLKAVFTEKGEAFELEAESDRLNLAPVAGKPGFTGVFRLDLSGRGDDVRIRRLTIEGPDAALKAEGRLTNFRSPEFALDVRYEVDAARAAEMLQLPFAWKGRLGGSGEFSRKAGVITFGSDISADGLVLSGVPMGRIQGHLKFNPADGGALDIEIRKPNLPVESLSLAFRGGRVTGEARGVYLDPVMSDIKVAWPVKSPVWGTFSLENGKLEAEGEFRDENLERKGDLFAFRGDVKVRFNLATQELDISTPSIQTSFGRLDARSFSRINGDIDAEIRGTITDLKQTREFVSLLLRQTFVLPEIRGTGYADVRLTGSSLDPKVDIRGSFSPAGFGLFNAAFVDAEATISGTNVEGNFHVDDPGLKADIRISVNPEKTEAEIENAEGDLGKVFAGLEISLPIQGRASGRFHVLQTLTSQDVTGTFSSPEITALGQTARDVKGSLEWKDGSLSFPDISLGLYGGTVKGRAMLATPSLAFDADIRADDIDLGRVVPGIGGLLSLSLTGRGSFGKDRLAGRYTVKDLLVPPIQKIEADGEVSLQYVQNLVSIEASGRFAPGDNEVQAVFRVPLTEATLNGSLKGHWTNLDLLLPWTGAKGRLDFTADVTGPRASPHVAGTVNFQGPLMPFPRFAHAVTDYSGTVHIDDSKLTLTDLKGKLGGGDISAAGDIGLGKSGVETIRMTMSGKDMQLAPLEGTRALVDGNAQLLKDSTQFVLDGDLLIKRMTWRREFYEGFSFSSATFYEANTPPSFFDDMTLNLRLRATDNAVVDNSLGRATGRFDLTVTGNVNDPVLLGDIEILRGTFIFQDQDFRILKGRVSFANPALTEPYLELRAETYIKDYRVTLNLSGYPSRLKPEFTSSPPLPPEDVLALLTMGEAFESTYAYNPETSMTMDTASLLSSQIAEEAKKRAESLFSLDRFRIDPFVISSSSEITARLTVGKKLSRNLLFIYATNLATQRDEIYNMEWEIRSDFSLVGVRNELGRLSFTLKYRTRF